MIPMQHYKRLLVNNYEESINQFTAKIVLKRKKKTKMIITKT